MAATRRSSNRKHGLALTPPLAAPLLAALVFALSCDTLFTPRTGFPEDSQNIRSTPRGAIEHLFRAYEDKRIDLFIELLPKNGTYRFFISPDYSDVYAATHSTDAILTRIEEDEYHHIKSGSYYYWGHDSEIAKHRRLFNMADAIEFFDYPRIDDERDYHYRITADNDTTHVELRAIGGELRIWARDTLYYTQKEGQMQVFLLEKEVDRRTGNRLWVIKDWFDLNFLL